VSEILSMVQEGTRFLHILVGAVGLILFWIPIFSKKGGKTHKRFGRSYIWSMYAVVATAAFGVFSYLFRFWVEGDGSVQNPTAFAFVLFLGYLSILALTIIIQGDGALRARANPRTLRTPWYLAVHAACLASALGILLFAILAMPPNFILLLALGPVGLIVGYEGLAYAQKDKATPQDWVSFHLNGMIGAGIAYHTAFAAFGARQIFGLDELDIGWMAVLPWILPTLVGIPATLYWKRRVARQFTPAKDATP